MDLGPHPQQRGVGDDEHRIPPLDPFPPGHEHILDNPIKRRPHHEGAQRTGVAGAVGGILGDRRDLSAEPTADEGPEMFLRHLNETVGLGQARARPVPFLPGGEENLLAGGVEVRLCHFEVARPFLDDPPREHPAVPQLSGAAVDLLHEEELRIGPEDLLPVDPQDPVLEHHLDVGQRGLVGERVEERLDVVGDRRGPLRGLDLDLFVILAAANIVPGHAHRGARHLGEGIPLGNALADLREDLRDDAVDRRGVVEAATGVVIDPSRDGEVVVHRHPGDRSHVDPGRGTGPRRE